MVALLVSGGPRSPGGTSSTTATTTAAPVPAGPPALPPPVGEAFGANVNRLFNDGTYTERQIDAQLTALRQTGATLARSDAFWEATEPAAPVARVHSYRWGFDDAVAGSLAAHYLTWFPIIDYSAPWAQSIPGRDHSPPRSGPDYAAYAAAVAARYGPDGAFWRSHPGVTARPIQALEIWNEPDNGEFWTPRPDPSDYAALYQLTRDAILAVDPSARVIIGGLTAPTTFLPALLAARPQLRGHIDGVAIHPYGTPLVVLQKVRADRAELDGLGLASIPLYVTEFGWTTEPPGALNWAPERLRPRYITEAMAALGHVDCGLAATLIYTWVTPERNPRNSEDWYGIHAPDGSPTPDSRAFTEGLRNATRRAPAIPLCAGG